MPVPLRAEPRERGRRVLPALADPCGVLQEAQRAQRFDEVELAPFEVAKPFVAFQQFFQLLRHRRGIAGHEHPQVLHSRAHARVVEVDEMRAGVGPQHVAGVAVTMKSQRRDIACAIERAAHAVERVCADARIDIAQVGRQVAVLEQPGARRISEAGDIEAGRSAKGRCAPVA